MSISTKPTIIELKILLNTRTPGFEIEKSLAFSGVGLVLFKLSYITLYIIRIKA